MKLKDAVFAIVTIVLWYFSVFYIAAPHSLHNELFGGFGMTHEQHHILGFTLFIVSMIVIGIWVATTKDESDEKKKKVADKGTDTTPPAPIA